MEFCFSPIDKTIPTLVFRDQTKFVSLFKWQFEIKVTVSFIFSSHVKGDSESPASMGHVFLGLFDSAKMRGAASAKS